jgi:hypothetical protein
MKTILKIAGGVVLGFLLVAIGDKTVEACHRKVSGKKFPGKRKKKRIRNNGRPGKVA